MTEPHPVADITPSSTSPAPPTPAQRRRFVAAVVLFVAWVAALGLLAVTSGSRPVPKPAELERR